MSIPPHQKKQHIATWRNKFPEKYSAIAAARKLPRQPGEQLHHWSYQKRHWKDVIPLQIKLHNLVHKFIIYDAERMMYRIASSGELLDSRESHQEFINHLTQLNCE